MSSSGAGADTVQWSAEDKKKLLNAVLEMGGSSNTKSFKTVESSIKWEDIRVEGKSTEECKAMYHRLIAKVRKYRTMQEIITDAVAFVDGPVRLDEYPDMPKKPPTAFGLFVKKRSKKFPDIKGTERMKVFASDWNELSEEKKETYKKKYLKRKKKYEEEFEIFKQNHPECQLPGVNSNSRPNVPLPSKLFVESRIEKMKSKKPELSNAEAVKILINKYKELPDKKKLKWIKKSMSCRQTYKDQVNDYLSHNPKSSSKPALLHLSKEEERIWDTSRGKPVQVPPKNVFSYFCSTKKDTVQHLRFSERSPALAALYRKLSEEDVKELTEAFKKEVEEYVQAYTQYYNSLTEEDRSKEKTPEVALAAYTKILQGDPKKKKKKKAKVSVDDADDKIDEKPDTDSDDDSDDSLRLSGVVAPAKSAAKRKEPQEDSGTPKKKLKHAADETSAEDDKPNEDDLLSMWSPRSSNGPKSPAEDAAETPTKSKSPKKTRTKKSKA